MKIREIIDAHYKDFLHVCTNKAINGEDEFDVLDNCCITAIRKFDEKDIDEMERNFSTYKGNEEKIWWCCIF